MKLFIWYTEHVIFLAVAADVIKARENILVENVNNRNLITSVHNRLEEKAREINTDMGEYRSLRERLAAYDKRELTYTESDELMAILAGEPNEETELDEFISSERTLVINRRCDTDVKDENDHSRLKYNDLQGPFVMSNGGPVYGNIVFLRGIDKCDFNKVFSIIKYRNGAIVDNLVGILDKELPTGKSINVDIIYDSVPIKNINTDYEFLNLIGTISRFIEEDCDYMMRIGYIQPNQLDAPDINLNVSISDLVLSYDAMNIIMNRSIPASIKLNMNINFI